MRPLQRLLRPRKAFTQPPFWSLDAPPIWASLTPGDREKIANSFESYVENAYKRNGIVFATILVRLLIFSEARFLWRRIQDGRPSDLYGGGDLGLLRRPWRGGTTGELLARMEQDTSLAGNFYATTVGAGPNRRIRRMRPDWVTIVTGVRRDELAHPDEEPGPYDLRAQTIGYVYEPPARFATPAQLLAPDQVVHWSPIPDPDAQWRGMSWLTPVIDEIRADTAATRHKLNFFRNGAVPGLVITYDASVARADFDKFVEAFQAQHAGLGNEYKTLHLGGGADPKIVGANLEQLDFKSTQGAGETRIAAAGGVHPVIAGFSEGMQGSSLNAGNFQAARRRVADGTIRPLWRSASAALQTICTPPDDESELWYDDRDVPFLREDAKEAAQIRKEDALTIESLVRAGFKPDSAREAVLTGDFRRLEHTGLFSVQLQPPGTPLTPTPTPDDPARPAEERP